MMCETLVKIITIRGFAYANIWMENYIICKQAKQKATQRSKGLRKDLYSDSAAAYVGS